MVTIAHPRTSNKRGTEQKKSVHLKCLVIPLHTDKLSFVLTITSPMRLQTYWFDVRGEGRALDIIQFTVRSHSTLYFVASRYTVPNHPEYRYFYILQYNDEHGRFACSCTKGWNFSQTQAACEHMEFMSEYRQKTQEDATRESVQANFRSV